MNGIQGSSLEGVHYVFFKISVNHTALKTQMPQRGQATIKNKSVRKSAETQSYRKVFSFAFLCGTLTSLRECF